MKISTLKKLIELEYERAVTSKSELKEAILNLIDLYESEMESETITSPPFTYPGIHPGDLITNPCGTTNEDSLVPYHTICSCNPANGGNGICGCIMPNKMVPKSGGKSNWASTASTTWNSYPNTKTDL